MRYQGHYSAQQHLVKQSRGKVFTGVCSGVAKYYKLSTVGLRAASVFAFKVIEAPSVIAMPSPFFA